MLSFGSESFGKLRLYYIWIKNFLIIFEMKMKVVRYLICFDVILWIFCICELMENLYSILGCKELVICEEIKKCY